MVKVGVARLWVIWVSSAVLFVVNWMSPGFLLVMSSTLISPVLLKADVLGVLLPPVWLAPLTVTLIAVWMLPSESTTSVGLGPSRMTTFEFQSMCRSLETSSAELFFSLASLYRARRLSVVLRGLV